MELFFKECRNILKSYIYYVFIAVVVLFYISQMGMKSPTDLEEIFYPPIETTMEEGESPYGEKESEFSIEMAPKVIINLYGEYRDNSYVTYPLGFYKRIKLDDKKTKEIEHILKEVTGKKIEELDSLWNDDFTTIPVSKDMTLEKFNELMKDTDELLGGGSAYSEEHISIRFTRIPITYEEVMEEYKYTIEKDRYTNGYARMFSDYIGIIMGIFPIFVAVFMSIKDTKTNMYSLVYSRNTSSTKLILSRYFALVFMMILPIIALGVKEMVIFISYANTNNVSIDIFAFFKYIVWWIVPTLMIVTSIGMFLTILTDTVLAIAIGLFIWFMNINSMDIVGSYPLTGLSIRHNNYRKGILIVENFGKIMTNRIFITSVSLLIVIATIYIYEKKRSGKIDTGTKTGKWFRFNKNKHKANNIK